LPTTEVPTRGDILNKGFDTGLGLSLSFFAASGSGWAQEKAGVMEMLLAMLLVGAGGDCDGMRLLLLHGSVRVFRKTVWITSISELKHVFSAIFSYRLYIDDIFRA
jgi:hypothetical protein